MFRNAASWPAVWLDRPPNHAWFVLFTDPRSCTSLCACRPINSYHPPISGPSISVRLRPKCRGFCCDNEGSGFEVTQRKRALSAAIPRGCICEPVRLGTAHQRHDAYGETSARQLHAGAYEKWICGCSRRQSHCEKKTEPGEGGWSFPEQVVCIAEGWTAKCRRGACP